MRAVDDTFATSASDLVVEPQLIRSYLILPVWLQEFKDENDRDLTLETGRVIKEALEDRERDCRE